VFFVPKTRKTSVLLKKKVFAGLGAFFVPKMAQDTSLRGAKVALGEPKYLQEGSCPPCPPTSRAYALNRLPEPVA